MAASDEFDRIFSVVATSVIYRDALAATRNGLPPWVEPFSMVDVALLEDIANQLDLTAGDLFVDLACGAGGPGIWLSERTGASLIGIDFSARAIAAARARADLRQHRGTFLVAEIANTTLEPACADGIVCVDALMFAEPQAAIDEMARIAKPGARVVVTAAESLVEPFMPTLVRDYRPYFERAGFEIQRNWENVAGHEQGLRLYRALLEREAALRFELGDVATDLIDEARNGCERAANRTTRVRNVIIVAERVAVRYSDSKNEI